MRPVQFCTAVCACVLLSALTPMTGLSTAAIDTDGDGIPDDADNCPTIYNPVQEDTDADGTGDACECACDCHADPSQCDGVQDVTDVVLTINVSFRGAAAISDPNANCPNERTDVNCSKSTDIVDVVKMVNVAFRGANPATEFCAPCGKLIWPFSIGDEWTHEHQVLDSTGTVIQRDTMVLVVDKDTVVQGSTWFLLTINGLRDDEMEPWQNRSDGVWAWDGSVAYLAWKYPAMAGEVYLMGADSVIIESIDEVVTVPAGTFVCVDYRWPGARGDSSRVYQNHHFAPGIGWVFSEEHYKTPSGFVYVHFRTRLIAYTVQ